jgi:hypothetical protein
MKSGKRSKWVWDDLHVDDVAERVSGLDAIRGDHDESYD